MNRWKRRWETTGWCVAETVVPTDLLEAARSDLGRFFPSAEEFAADVDPERNRPLRTESHSVMYRFPFESDALNRLVLHDCLVHLAEGLLGTADLRLYQGLLSAKYSEGAPDEDQLLHADYGNHTVVVPRHDVGFQQLEMFVYLTDVTPDTAATRMVPLSLTTDIPVERTYLRYDEYADLYAAEEPASGPAGSVLLYRPDTYHRGVPIAASGVARFMLHVSFKPAGTDWLGSPALPSAAEGLPWHRVVNGATPRQLLLLGFPEPGHPYWNDETLRGVAARYPALDMTAWTAAWRRRDAASS